MTRKHLAQQLESFKAKPRNGTEGEAGPLIRMRRFLTPLPILLFLLYQFKNLKDLKLPRPQGPTSPRLLQEDVTGCWNLWVLDSTQ